MSAFGGKADVQTGSNWLKLASAFGQLGTFKKLKMIRLRARIQRHSRRTTLTVRSDTVATFIPNSRLIDHSHSEQHYWNLNQYAHYSS